MLTVWLRPTEAVETTIRAKKRRERGGKTHDYLWDRSSTDTEQKLVMSNTLEVIEGVELHVNL